MRRWVWRVLLLVLAAAALAGSALAADTNKVIVVKNNIQYELDLAKGEGIVLGSDNKKITAAPIKASVRGVNITEIADGAFSGFEGLASVTIPSTITKIGQNAFQNCGNLDNVVIPGSVTTVGKRAFFGCTRLETLTFRDKVALDSSKTPTVQSSTTIQSMAFAWCENLTTLTLSGSVSAIEDLAFSDCKNSLRTVIIPEGVTKIGEKAFANCTQLRLISIPGTVAAFDKVILEGNSNLKTVHYGGDAAAILPGLPDSLKGTDDNPGACVHHTFSGLNYVKEPTCTSAGLVRGAVTCEKGCAGLSSERELPKLEHINDWTSASDETSPKPCQDQHWTYTGTCKLCQHTTTERETIKATAEHNPYVPAEGSNVLSEQAATCGADGYKIIKKKVCNDCGEVLETDEETIDATGNHTAPAESEQTEKIVTPATCVAVGVKQMIGVCTVCKQEYVVTDNISIPATGVHTWGKITWVETTAPTCTKEGEETAGQTCAVCDEPRPDADLLAELNADTKTRRIDALGHELENRTETTTVPPKCNQKGQKTVTGTCVSEHHVEGEDKDGPKDVTFTEEIKELPHTPETPVEEIPATCTTDGKKIIHPTKCSVCQTQLEGEEKEEIIPAAGHKWGSPAPDPANTDRDKAATCGKVGEAHVILTCSECGEKKAQVHEIPATGEHTWGEWKTDEADETREVRTCSVCGDTETQPASTTPGGSTDTPSGDEPSGDDPSTDKPDDDKPGTTTTPEKTSYSVNLIQSSNGSVSASKSTAGSGDPVTLTVWADSGYELDQLWVTTSGGSARNLTSLGGNQYRFSMPAASVEVRVSFSRRASSSSGWSSSSGSSSSSSSTTTPVQTVVQSVPRAVAAGQRFADVPASHWAAGEINWANQMGYMNGGRNGFNPDGNITFQQMWMVLARLTGSRPASMEDARRWALNGGFAEGAAPNGAVSRHQLVTALYRCAHLMGSTNRNTTSLAGYPDSRTVPTVARDAFSWAVANGVIGGNANGRLDPNGTLTRAQFSVILYRFSQRV